MEGQETVSSSPSQSNVASNQTKLPTTVSVPTESSSRHFLPIEGGEENFAGRQGNSSSSSGNSSDNTNEEEKKKKRSTEASATTALTDSDSSSELPPREKVKRRRIEYLSTAKGGLQSLNEKLLEENKSLRKTIEALKQVASKKKNDQGPT